jgi:hypothetical protein
LCNKTKQKAMTTFQKTLIAYSKGQKSMAFIAYKNDPTANKNFTFSEFCAAFDKLMIQHEMNRPINPITKKRELPIWA